MSGKQEKDYREIQKLAQAFWPAFKTLCMKHKICVSVLGGWYAYVNWRDKKSNKVFPWVLKSFLKGLDCKFLSCLVLGVLVSEIPFIVLLVNSGMNFRSSILIAPLYSALPALLGMLLLDYLLEPDLSRAILFPAILAIIVIALLGYYFGSIMPNLTMSYIITGCVIFMSWCIKVGDRRMIDQRDDAQRVLPKEDGLTTDIDNQNTVRRGRKTIIVNRI